jgi:hypothetical protein
MASRMGTVTPNMLSKQAETVHEAAKRKEFRTSEGPAAGIEAQGVPGEQVISLFLIFGLFLSAGWGDLISLITAALSLGKQDAQQGNPGSPSAKNRG